MLCEVEYPAPVLVVLEDGFVIILTYNRGPSAE
jgi:hypothetical protein